MKKILTGDSTLALFVACIAGTNNPDFAVTFDDLAEFASAFHRRSDFHFFSPEFELLVSCYLRYSILCLSGTPVRQKTRNHPFPENLSGNGS